MKELSRRWVGCSSGMRGGGWGGVVEVNLRDPPYLHIENIPSKPW